MVTQQIGPAPDPQGFLEFANNLAGQVSGGQARLNTADPDAIPKLFSFVDSQAAEFERQTGTPAAQSLTSSFQQLAPRQIVEDEGGGGGFLNFVTRSLLPEDFLDNMREAGLFGRIGANVLGELTNPLSLATLPLLATGVGAPLAIGLRGGSALALRPLLSSAAGRTAVRAGAPGLAAGAGIRSAAGAVPVVGQRVLQPAVGLAGRAVEPVAARGLGGRLAGEAALGAGAIAGGGLAVEGGQLIPGPTRSAPGQLALQVGGGLLGAGATGRAISDVINPPRRAADISAPEVAAPARFVAGPEGEVTDTGATRFVVGPEGEVTDLTSVPTQDKVRALINFAPEAEAAFQKRLQQERARRFARAESSAARAEGGLAQARETARGLAGGELASRRYFDPIIDADFRRGPAGLPDVPLDELRITETGVRGGFSQDDLAFFDSKLAEVYGRPGSRAENLRATNALVKFLSGDLPSPAEFRLLRPILGDETVDVAQELVKSKGRRAFETAVDFAGLPRGIMASFDLSAVLRQGGLLTVTHPRNAFFKGRDSAAARMIRAIWDKDFVIQRQQELLDDPALAPFFDRNLPPADRLFIHRIGGKDLGDREEVFLSRFLKKIPGVAASERAFATYLNEMRVSLTKQRIARIAEQQGVSPEAVRLNPEFIKKNNRMMNFMTGRGSMGPLNDPDDPRLRMTRDLLSVAFWSPRLLLSRFQTLIEGGKALRNINADDPQVRQLSREIARDVAIYAGGVTGAISALALHPGISVETNPKSSDFGKVRVGNTRLDPWAGFQQIGRYATQYVTGERKSANSGIIRGVDRDEVLGRFLRSKLAPGLPTLAASDLPEDLVLSGLTGGGENFIGEPITGEIVTPGAGARAATLGQAEPLSAELNILIDNMVPLLAQDIFEALESDGLVAATSSGLGATFGLGATSFSEGTQSVPVAEAVQERRSSPSPAGLRFR